MESTLEPSFVRDEEKYLFFHWFWTDCSKSECTYCAQVKDIVTFAVENLLMGCIKVESDGVSGCDLASFYVGKITYDCARDILKGRNRHMDITNTYFRDFQTKLTKNELHVLQFVRVGGLHIFCALLDFFVEFVNKKPDMIHLKMNFLLLCFHINGLFVMSSSAVENLWAETLRSDATLILFANCDKEINFHSFYKQFADLLITKKR